MLVLIAKVPSFYFERLSEVNYGGRIFAETSVEGSPKILDAGLVIYPSVVFFWAPMKFPAKFIGDWSGFYTNNGAEVEFELAGLKEPKIEEPIG